MKVFSTALGIKGEKIKITLMLVWKLWTIKEANGRIK